MSRAAMPRVLQPFRMSLASNIAVVLAVAAGTAVRSVPCSGGA